MSHELTQQSGKTVRFSRRRRAMLPHLGNAILSRIYGAFGGNRRLPILFKRAIANGLHPEHIETLYRQAKQPSDIPPLMSDIGDSLYQRGLYWNDVGVKSRARDHHLEAALWYIYTFVSSPSLTVQTRALARVQSSYQLAAAHFNFPAEKVTIHCPSGEVSGYLRVPVQQVENEAADGQSYINATYGCAILFNAFNSPKEELHLTENALLATGLATLSFDYPGFGDEGHIPEIANFNIEELTNSLLLFLASRNDIDTGRIALFGTGLGGRLALYAAAKLPERFRAAASLSAPLDLVSDLTLLLPAMQRELAVSNGCSKAALFDLARRTPLRAILPELQTPVLVVGGGRDVIAMPEEARTIYNECAASDKKLIICQSGGHGCYEMMPSLRHEIAQWIRQRL